MVFFGDQAWFYISARDLILGREFPLLGITSSHTWIHQGPVWTYMLVPGFLISNFHPLSGVYLSVVFGILSLILVYKIGKDFFSQRFAIIFFLLYAFSPLVVFHVRLSYHTSPIPFVVLGLFYAAGKWVQGNVIYFPLTLFALSLLYNFELATVIFVPIILFLLLYGFFKREKFVSGLRSKKIIFFSILAVFIPMLPILIHDVQNGFPQTVVFAGWFGYKLLQFIGILEKNSVDNSSFQEGVIFFFQKYKELLSVPYQYISVTVFLASVLFSIYKVFTTKNFISPLGIILSCTCLGLLAYFLSGVPSEAYLVMLFPGLIFCISLLIYGLRRNIIIGFVLFILIILNVYYIISTNYLTKGKVTISKKIAVTEKIFQNTNGKKVELFYKGPGQEFKSSVMPYEYLLWWRAGIESDPDGKRWIIKELRDTVVVEEFYR